MDPTRFDEATKLLSHTGSRRRSIQGLAGAALGGVLGVRLSQPSTAAPVACVTCTSDADCAKGRCRTERSGIKGCCPGYWSRGNCYVPKPRNNKWKYQWKQGKLRYQRRNSTRFRFARILCFAALSN